MKTTAATSDCGTGPPRFVRRTTLGANEYRKNFHQIDGDVIAAVTSPEADRVTPLMSKMYLRLVSAPSELWERQGVLYFAAREDDGHMTKASKVLYELLGVASATAHKALQWMHEQGIIGYFSGKNGVGIRIFLNRAAGSIGVRTPEAGKKILPFARGSNDTSHGSSPEPAFKDSSAVLENLDSDLNSRAPKNGAETNKEVNGLSIPIPTNQLVARTINPSPPTEEIVERLLRELVPSVESVATRAATREHERTREWLESKGLPKAARVAQREAYNVLRQHGLISAEVKRARSDTTVGRSEATLARARLLSAKEVRELAETCVAMLEVHGQAIDVTLAELSAEAGGVLLAEDAPRVRELAEAMAYGGGKE